MDRGGRLLMELLHTKSTTHNWMFEMKVKSSILELVWITNMGMKGELICQ